MLYLGPAWHSGEWAGSPRVHVADIKGSGEDVESILRPVTSFSMTAFIVGQGLTKREGCTDRLAMALTAIRYQDETLGNTVGLRWCNGSWVPPGAR